MNKQEVVKVLEATLLLYDGMPEEEVTELLDSFSVSCAKYIKGFLESYKR